MRLYVNNLDSEKKIYLDLDFSVKSRRDLENKLGKREFFLENKRYTVDDVIAEADNSSFIAGTVAGLLIGSILLPGIGSLFGSFIGASAGGIGANALIKLRAAEINSVENFNNSESTVNTVKQ